MRKMVKKVFGTILAASLLLGSLSGAVLAEKTYPDAEKWGFETDWQLSNKSEDKHVSYNTTDTANILEGKRSLKITGDADIANVGVHTSYIPAAAGSGKTQYVTGKIKVDFEKESESKLVVAMLDGDVTVGSLDGARNVWSYTFGESCGWTDIRLESMSDPQGEKIMYIVIWLTGEGTVYADDFKLVEDDNMTKNSTFLPNPKYPNRVAGWNNVSSRGAWGTDWSYDSESGALKLEKTVDTVWLYTAAPYANKMEKGETYKVSLRFKADAANRDPGIYVLYSQPTNKESKLSAFGNKVTLTPVGTPVVNEFCDYVGYFTMPDNETHYGFGINGPGSKSTKSKSYYDNFYVEKEKTGAPFVVDESGNGTIEAGGTVTAKMHFAEKEAKNVQMVIAVYSTSGGAKVLESVNIENYAIEAGVPVDKEVSVTVPAGDKTYTAKAFCWDADDLLTPLP